MNETKKIRRNKKYMYIYENSFQIRSQWASFIYKLFNILHNLLMKVYNEHTSNKTTCFTCTEYLDTILEGDCTSYTRSWQISRRVFSQAKEHPSECSVLFEERFGTGGKFCKSTRRLLESMNIKRDNTPGSHFTKCTTWFGCLKCVFIYWREILNV